MSIGNHECRDARITLEANPDGRLLNLVDLATVIFRAARTHTHVHEGRNPIWSGLGLLEQ